MMNLELTKSQIEILKNKRKAGEVPELADHLKRMMTCAQKNMVKQANGGNMYSCIASSECIPERVAFSNCVYKYQKSTQLCKV